MVVRQNPLQAVDQRLGDKGAVDAFTAVCWLLSTVRVNRTLQEHLAVRRQETLKSVPKHLKQDQGRGELGNVVPMASLAGYYTMVLHGLSLSARHGASREELTEM